MEVKKSPKADLENKKSVFMQIALVTVLSLVFIAFEWSTLDKEASDGLMVDDEAIEEEIIPITRHKEVEPPPPKPKLADILEIVQDDVELDEELIIEDTEATDATEVDFSNLDIEEEEADDKLFFHVEEKPEFPGGESALNKYLYSEAKYPTIAEENGVEGRVFVRFVINTDGSVTDAEIMRDSDPSLEKEALRVIRSMPKWKPGEQSGRRVRVSYNVSINFKLK